MNKYFESLTDRFQKGMEELNSKRREWPDFADKATVQLQTFCNLAKEVGNYEYLYVTSNKTHFTGTNQGYIQFYAGLHATGVSKTTVTITTEQDGRTRRRRNHVGVVEESGCLSIVQEPKGGVFFIVYPSRSPILQWKDEYLVLKYFPKPSEITMDDVNKAAQFYLRYALYTSIFSSPTKVEKIELWWKKFKFKDSFNRIIRGVGFLMRLTASVTTGLPTT